MKSFSQSPRDFLRRKPGEVGLSEEMARLSSHSRQEAAQDLLWLPLRQVQCSSRTIEALRGQGGVGSQGEALRAVMVPFRVRLFFCANLVLESFSLLPSF